MGKHCTVIGIDLGIQTSRLAVMDPDCEAIAREGQVVTMQAAFGRCVSRYATCMIARKVGTHSP
ncbi:MAG TPA: hypothetical protein PLO37_09000 [Candidatus Hydrogenedentes bacterium]|nr:hypothetical protein [Candidatus Hydrogenedentota bacterium]HPG66972.1 hypothetical protein [Candidatus Hydrogenedentota bacterium]